jgi:predicted dehydrogenase
VVSLGQRILLHTIKFLLDETVLWNLVAVCDSNAETILGFRSENPNIRCFQSISQLLAHHTQGVLPSIDCAYVVVPHSMYAEVIPRLLRAKIHVLKEKPAGSSTNEQRYLQQLAFKNSTRLVAAGQSRYGSRYARLQEWIPLIGRIHLVEELANCL